MNRIMRLSTRLLMTVTVLGWCTAIADAQTGNGQIAGTVNTTDGKSVPNAIVMLNVLPGVEGTPYHAQGQTGGDGTFSFTQVPAGKYQVCPQAPNTDLLAPCSWTTSPTVTVNAGQTVQMPAIQMQHGVLFLVRVNDAAGVAASTKAIGKSAALEIGIRASSTMVQPVPLLASDANGYDYGCYVPASTALQLSVSSSAFSLADASAQSINPKNGGVYTVQVPSSGQAAAGQPGGPPTFTINGHQ